MANLNSNSKVRDKSLRELSDSTTMIGGMDSMNHLSISRSFSNGNTNSDSYTNNSNLSNSNNSSSRASHQKQNRQSQSWDNKTTSNCLSTTYKTTHKKNPHSQSTDSKSSLKNTSENFQKRCTAKDSHQLNFNVPSYDIPPRHFMNGLLKHTGIALLIIIPLAAYSAFV